MKYQEFLTKKEIVDQNSGFEIDVKDLNSKLFDFQKAIVKWALMRGRAAVFAACGLGKSFCQLEWSDQIHKREKKPVLILAPLAITFQTKKEGDKFEIKVNICESQKDIINGINITNYEKLHKYDVSKFVAIVLDESSLLRDFTGKTRNQIIELFKDTKYKLACSASPAPNDHEELGNHSEFLGIMTRMEMLASFFVNDTAHTGTWRLKGHVKDNLFWKWMSSWSVMFNTPSDIGFSDEGYVLPKLHYHEHILKPEGKPKKGLFHVEAKTLNDRRRVRKDSICVRSDEAAKLIKNSNEQWVIWCGLNSEQDYLEKNISDSVSIRGSTKDEDRILYLDKWLQKKVLHFISKPSIFGLGLNLQQCCNAVFIGLSDCYDDKTEVLTRRGWISFKDVDLNDDIATVNKCTLELEYQKPTRKVYEFYSGSMFHFNGRANFDLFVTPNHKLFVNRNKIRFPNDKSDWDLQYASELFDNYKKSEYTMLSVPKFFKGKEIDSIVIPLMPNQRISSRSKIINSIPTEIFMKLIGWYVSEGYCRPLNSKESGRIVICQSDKHPENRKDIIEIFKVLNLSINFKTKDITVYSTNLAYFLTTEFGTNSDNMRIPQWVKDLDGRYLEILRDTMLKGDGCHHKEIPTCYRTNSEILANDFQELCIKTGIRGSVKRRECKNRFGRNYCYDVNIAWKHNTPSIWKKPEKLYYEGMIGCVTVPNNTLIVRRNGIPIISGNSWEELFQAIRRIWRFGQEKEVNIHIFLEEREGAVLSNIKRKDKQAIEMMNNMILYMKDTMKAQLQQASNEQEEYNPQIEMRLPIWLKNGNV
jgi:hypothetical protein